ncbi:FAD-binding oxidoreductase [Synechococcus sp. GreenBA-s]|nr:FAD-binding oxidoreductase [Synechococcus sp. GreenBA-s]
MTLPSALPTALPPGLPAPAGAAQLAALGAELAAAGVELLERPEQLEALSADAFVYSPVLEPLLHGRRAQLGVRPRSAEQVRAVAAACARHGVALTPRGAGTGNYGQSVPLAGGVVLDGTGLNRLRHFDPVSGVVTAEPGILLAELERQLGAHGRALRLLPSTVRSATLGGFIAGGSGGIGSLRWGFLRDPGHLLGLEVVTLEPEPRLLQLDALASQPLNHAYGSNGILTAIRLATAAAVPWQQLVLGFDAWDQALAAAQQLPAMALELNELALLEAPVAALLPWPSGCPEAEGRRHRLLLLAAPAAAEVIAGLLPGLGGQLLWQAPQGESRGIPLRELCWNHTTLHVRGREPGWTYLQLLLPQPEAPALAALRQRWGDDLLWHLEAVRSFGAQRLAAIPLVRWRGPEALQALIEHCRELGAVVFNPHVVTVEDGGLGVVDADQVAAKRAYDPAGLLNPGKLRGWRG